MMVLSLSTFAASVETDRSWYLAGEQMKISVTADDALIVYAELCDTRGLAAGVVIRLQNGLGEGTIELPSNLHSGYYVLSVYSRHESQVYSQHVAVVNPLHKSVDDDIQWVAADSCWVEASGDGSQETGVRSQETGVRRQETGVREMEGHIIKARIKNVYDGNTFTANTITPSLSIIGKQIHYYEGQMVDDSTAVFYTYDIHGKFPLVLAAKSFTGQSLPIEMMSPFAALLPKQLPHLVFHYNRSEVEARSLDMQRHQIAITPAKREAKLGDRSDESAEDGVLLEYDASLLGTKPDLSYNLDEYRQFLTINEALLEYVQFVTKMRVNGVLRLVVRKEQVFYDYTLPTLVLIDGMPVFDIERLLNYDARRIHYINIYGEQYTFGGGVYNGILSFVTRSGRLTNYPTEPNAQYLVYTFP